MVPWFILTDPSCLYISYNNDELNGLQERKVLVLGTEEMELSGSRSKN